MISYNLRSQIQQGGRIEVYNLIDSHPLYKRYLPRWEMLSDSYVGGMEYQMGEYLERYYYETQEEYVKRLRTTALDNHVKSVIGIYNSFLYRRPIVRKLDSIDQTLLDGFMQDCDLEGRNFDQMMREVSIQSMIYGHVWVLVDRPATQVGTRAEELEQGIRPYMGIVTPENVLDWRYERLPNGKYELEYFKVKEAPNKSEQFVREFTKEEINLFKYDGTEESDGVLVETVPNTLGKIPCVVVYSNRSPHRGIGISPVGDIADAQKMLFDMSSEIMQLIQLTNHPTLVKTADTEAAAGAGGIIQMPQTLDPGLRPSLLQPSGANIDSVISSMEKIVESIDRQACLGGIRSVESRRLSGIGLQSEFQLLNSRLSDFAANLEHAEEQIFRLVALFNNMVFEGEIQYPRSFSIQDKANDVAMLKLAKEAKPMDPKINDYIDQQLLRTLIDDEDVFQDVMSDNTQPMPAMPMAPEQPAEQPPPLKLDMPHPPMENAADMVQHMRDMIREGYTNEQILDIHPEIFQFFEDGLDG